MKRFMEAIVWLLLMLCALYGLVWFMTLPAGCSAPERIDLSDAFARGIVKQTVEELKVVLGMSMLDMQNQMRELLWETFYKITGVGAGGTAAIVGHRYTGGYNKIQKKAVNGK